MVAHWVLKRRGSSRWTLPQPLRDPVIVFLVVSVAVYLFLQLRISFDVYRLFAPLLVINFPWRMLALITPIGIILVVALADGLMRRYPIKYLWLALTTIWLTCLVALSPVTSNWVANYEFLAGPGQFPPISLFTAPKFVDYQRFNGFFLGSTVGLLYGIFLPKVFTPNGSELSDDGELYTRLHQHQAGAQSLSHVRCTVVGPSHAAFETLQLTYAVTCGGATRLALPLSYNGYSTIFVEGTGGKLRQIPYLRVRTDPRIVINVTSSRPERVVVHLPTLWGVLS
jgi:hypothetical protein